VPAPAPPPQPAPPPTPTLPSPLGRGPQIPTRRFLGQARFEPSLIEISRERIGGWWAEQALESAAPLPSDFGIDGDTWNEDPEEALFRLAVAAALITRVGGALAPARYQALASSGALAALMQGVAHDGPLDVDPNALLLASLVARRCAEHPDLSAELERASDADALFKLLNDALGEGLFGLELFWLLRALKALAIIRVEGLDALTSIPRAETRHALFRLGLLETPYAHDAPALVAAARAAHQLLPSLLVAEEAIEAFSRAAGCAYGCPHRRRCDLPCRERGDL
ncbi:hypothetical protein KKF91_15985, partial [Myxococcota bacterium]|nr:hypothetical protein [Myxococcota bacterium]